MSVILTNGQSWEQLAAAYTLDPSYAPAIATQNNMPGESITGKRFRVEIPDTWMQPQFAGKQIDLTGVSSGLPMWVWFAVAGAVVLLESKTLFK